jgi:broad specificity phosphatase PhoE
MVLKNPNKYEEGKTLVYFIRHGDRKFIPNTPPPHDTSLSEKGKAQAKSLAEELLKIKDEVDVLYSSSMKRAKETAEIVGKQLNKTPIILENFQEVQKILEKPNIFDWKYWKARIKFYKRQIIFEKILRENQGKLILIVAHGRLNRMLMGRKLGLSHKRSNVFESTNCHMNIVRFKKTKLDYIYCINSEKIVKQ